MIRFLTVIMIIGLLLTVAGLGLVLFYDLTPEYGVTGMMIQAALITVGSLMFLPTKIYLMFWKMNQSKG